MLGARVYEVTSKSLELNCINKDQLLYVYTIVFFLSIVMCAKIMELSLSLQSTEKHITF